MRQLISLTPGAPGPISRPSNGRKAPPCDACDEPAPRGPESASERPGSGRLGRVTIRGYVPFSCFGSLSAHVVFRRRPFAAPPSILIERPEHARAVEVLVDRAFGPGRFAKSSERLREGNHKLDDCSFVALHEGRVIGSVRLWPVKVGDKSVAFLGPLAVDADERKHGLGQALVEAACEAAAKAGWRAVLLVGDAPISAGSASRLSPPPRRSCPVRPTSAGFWSRRWSRAGTLGLVGPIRIG